MRNGSSPYEREEKNAQTQKGKAECVALTSLERKGKISEAASLRYAETISLCSGQGGEECS